MVVSLTCTPQLYSTKIQQPATKRGRYIHNKTQIVYYIYFLIQTSVLDSSQVKELFDSLSVLHFWDLNIDSLNETRDHVIFDDATYKFQIENSKGRKVLESYAPEYYIGIFPDMRERITFLKGKEIFERWWQKYCNQQNDY